MEPPAESEPPPLNSPFTPQPDWTLISQGAEARIWKIPSTTTTTGTPSAAAAAAAAAASASTTGVTMIAKERFSKAYRHPVLDEKLTKSRCRAEGRILEKCRTNTGSSSSVSSSICRVNVPKVIRMEAPILYLEYIDGITVRTYLEENLLNNDKDGSKDNDNNNNNNSIENDNRSLIASNTAAAAITDLAQRMGTMIGTLHSIGCIHGDLTTSNMMLRNKKNHSTTTANAVDDEDSEPVTKRSKRSNIYGDASTGNTCNNNEIVLIDFGLAKNTTSAEERAVDLYVLERALTSTHPHLPMESFFMTLLQCYKIALENNNNNNNSNSKSSTNISSDHPKTKNADAVLTRLEQVRLRGRKRECFG